jgi:carbonic anhydrase/acetyltransferase-like protein (isoleucine patch superfamily)
MSFLRKCEKVIVFLLRDMIAPWNPPLCTRLMVGYYRRRGMKIHGQPNYLSNKIWFDGPDYSWIELGDGCTISSNVRILTHDGAPYTIGRSIGMTFDTPFVVFRPVRIGPFAFVGTNSVIMPGADIGRGALVGGGSVVRGKVPPWTIVVGSPAVPMGDSREYLRKQLERAGLHELLKQFHRLMEAPREGQPQE